MNKWNKAKNYNHYLLCKKVTFFSNKDEAAFFEWIEKIECIESISAAHDELYLDIVKEELDSDDINDLIGLFARYHIEMKQLLKYKTEKNRSAFFPWQQEIGEF